MELLTTAGKIVKWAREVAVPLSEILIFATAASFISGFIGWGYKIWRRCHGMRHGVEALFAIPGERPGPDSTPSRFLREEFQIVCFRGRKKEIEELTNWACHKVPPGKNVSVALVTGGPGRGKSRLARRLCKEAKKWNSGNWLTGFLKEDVGDERRDASLLLIGERRPVLAVIDYAERRTEQVKKIVSAALASKRSKHPVRVLLIARAKGEEWWSGLEGAFDSCSINPFEDGQIKLLELASIEKDPAVEDRCQEFNRALKAFRKVLGKEREVETSKDDIPSDLLEAQKVEVLDIHVAALLAAYGDGDDDGVGAGQNERLCPVQRSDDDDDGGAGQANVEVRLFNKLVKREQKAWDQAVDEDFKGQGLKGKSIRRAIAWLAATDGLTRENDAVDRLFLLPSFREGTRERREGIARIATALYPGSKKEWWGGMAPDRLTTWLTRELDETIEDDMAKEQPVIVADLPEDALANLLRHLTWRVQRYGDTHEQALANAIRAGGGRGIAVAAKVGAETGDPIGRIAAGILSDPEDEEAAHEVFSLIGVEKAVPLRELALAAAKILHRNAAKASDQERAGRASNLGFHLSGLGQSEEALVAIEESVVIFRRLAETQPDEARPGLAESLNNLGACLFGLGRHKESLAAIEEAIVIHRGLAEARPDEFRSDLAMSLNNLSLSLFALRHREEGLTAIEESVAICRGLTEVRPDEFRSGLAESLNSLGLFLLGLERHEEALTAVEESVSIRRGLAEARPDEFRPALAGGLNFLSICLHALKRLEKAFAATEESVAIHRDLTKTRPGVFRPRLAASLNSLGDCLSDLGRHEEALAAIDESVTIYRDLVATQPGAFCPSLAVSLDSLSNCLSSLGRREKAFAAIDESVAILRDLAETRPDEFRPLLAESLNKLNGSLSGLGRREEVLAVLEESVAIRRDLAETRPDEFRPGLAAGLKSLGVRLSDFGRREEALAAIEESVAIRRDLAEIRPDEFRPGLVASLNNLRVCLSGLGRHEEALAAIEEAVSIGRDLAEARPDVFCHGLAICLGVLNACLSELGRHEEASRVMEEATAIWPGISNLLQESRDVPKNHRHNDQDSKP